MAGVAAPKIVRAQRQAAALKLLADGTPFSAAVARVALDWGCSRRQARNVCNAALQVIAADLETMDVKEMLASTIHRLERIAQKAEDAGQYAAAVGAARSVHEFVIAPHINRK